MADMSAGILFSPAAIAVNRFGLGARPYESPPGDPKVWLRDQLTAYQPRSRPFESLPNTATIAASFAEQRVAAFAANDARRRQEIQAAMRRENRQQFIAAANARILSAVETDTPFAERLVHFWANHFAISADKVVVVPFVGSFEIEAIRPHIVGKFEDMLFAAERHAGMTLYLDQAASVGPGSAQARAAQARNPNNVPGLNENLAREIMELHTLGVRSGYTQNDVTEFARALTGWSTAAFGRGPTPNATPGEFVFRSAFHEPGTRTVLGRRYDQAGEAQAQAILRDLAHAPATATHIATKLARHFAGDTPPASLISRLASAFSTSGGHLAAVYRVLIDSPETWIPQPVKFKTPWDWTISALRGTDLRSPARSRALDMLRQLGQSVWQPGSPAGWSDNDASWAAPDALVRRVEAASQLAALVPVQYDPRELVGKLLMSPPGPATRSAIAGADNLMAGLVLMLVSPEFQRR